jgi:hypothetical protein
MVEVAEALHAKPFPPEPDYTDLALCHEAFRLLCVHVLVETCFLVFLRHASMSLKLELLTRTYNLPLAVRSSFTNT